jgi:hypothetical protein
MGYLLNNTSSITSIVSTRIYHGTRPLTTIVPSINYYEITPRRNKGIEYTGFTVNCRASSASVSRDLANIISDLFEGETGYGAYGMVSSFSVMRSTAKDRGLISEPDNVFNSPIEVLLTYPLSTIS